MYNYDLRQDYYSYNNNNYNKPLYTEDANPNSVYDPWIFKRKYVSKFIQPI